MVVKFLSKISGNFFPLQRQRSSNSITSCKSSSNSTSSTPKHKSSTLNNSSVLQNDIDKSSCFKSDNSRNSKKLSRVEFDFSYQRCNDSEMIKLCPKHNCCNPVFSSSSSNNSNPIEIPKQKNINCRVNPMASKSFSIYETINRVHNAKTTPTCKNQRQTQKQCENFELTTVSSQTLNTNSKKHEISFSLDEKRFSSNINSQDNSQSSYNKNNIDLDCFTKSAKRKVPTKLNHQLTIYLEMKERIAQAEVFLEALGGAKTSRNRDSSRYVRKFKWRGF